MNYDDFIALVSQETGLAVTQLQPEATLATLDISSIDVVSMVFELEDRHGIEIQPEGLTREMSLRQLFELVAARTPQ